MSQEEIDRKLEEQKINEEKKFNEVMENFNLEQEAIKKETQDQLNYLDEIRKRIEENKPITEEDITNVTAIFEGKPLSLKNQVNKESSQTHK